MGKTSKWIRNFLTGKKDKQKEKDQILGLPTSDRTENPTTPISITPTTPKEKRRWSFRRSSAAAAGQNGTESIATTPPPPAVLESENEQRKHATAAQASAAVIRATAAGRGTAIEEAAAIKIQSVFRSYLAKKALCALKGLVKLQALVRGHLVRKQATMTLRCMQALVTVQARARAQRIRMVEESKSIINQSQFNYNHRQTTQDNRFKHSYEMDSGMEENIKIVEMDIGESKLTTKSRNSYSNNQHTECTGHRFSTHSAPNRSYSKPDHQELSPAPSALTDISPKTCSGHFEDYPLGTARSSPRYHSSVSKPDPSTAPFAFPSHEYAESLCYEYPFFPNYMANTESSRAKVRSQSAPKMRPDSFERQLSRRRPSLEGRNIPRAVRMQRSSSHVGSTAQNYQHPWSIKLDRSSVSLKDSECRSTSTVLTNTNYCRSLVGFDVSRVQFRLK
ncbi:hypothetical protein CsSME_00033512 [Camellia sinensis var. sinensis]